MNSERNDSADPVAIKLSAARTRLIIEKPFLGALVLRLPLVQADSAWLATTATDARKLYYNRSYIASLDLAQTQGMLAHEALHCALSHFARRQHRDKRRWDIACDLAINPLLVSEGFTLPKGALYLEGYEGMTAEEIYHTIDDTFEQEPLDQHVYDQQDQAQHGSGSGNETIDTPPNSESECSPQETQRSPDQQQLEKSSATSNQQPQSGADRPPPLTEQERDQLNTQWQQRLAGAAQQALQAGKLRGAMARMVDHLLQPQLPWRSLLAHYVTAIARDDYSYARPSTRRGEPAIYPSLRSAQVSVVVALDTSGSISDTEMDQFLSEVNAIKSQMRAKIVLHACDARLAPDGPWVYEAWEEFSLPRHFEGGGGTVFTPVFEWVNRQDEQPNLLIYFTDADGEFPDKEPNFPVVWLVKGKEKVPWGQRVQLN